MSLTSYRAAPPRDNKSIKAKREKRVKEGYWPWKNRGRSGSDAKPMQRLGLLRTTSVVLRVRRLGRPGSDLLFRVLRRSTIGAEGFHGRVRDGSGGAPSL